MRHHLVIDPARIQSGDVILRRGESWVSNTVRAVDKRTVFSHAGIALKSGSELLVLHVEPRTGHGLGYVVAEPITHFLSSDRASDARVYRAKVPNSGARARIIAAASSYAKSRTVFDTEFDARTPDRLYCTELVWRAYQAGGVDLAPGFRSRPAVFHGLRVILISDLEHSTALSEVAHAIHSEEVIP